MASIRKRGARWQVQVRREGHPPVSRSFVLRSDAEAWARKVEAEIDRGSLGVDHRLLQTTSLKEVLIRYRETVSVRKRGAAEERYRLNRLIDHPIARHAIGKVTPKLIAHYRDERLSQVQGETVRRELTILRHAFEVARKEWGIPLTVNPVAQVDRPAPAKPRNRRLEGDELERLLSACRSACGGLLGSVLRFAAETGMRKGEILRMRWQDVDLKRQLVFIGQTKNGHARTIPLSRSAVELLAGMPRKEERVFPTTGNALRLSWDRLRERAGVADLHFHDLRHEAISSFFEKGLSVPEVALISGHRDMRMLFRYTHLRPEDVAQKLG